MSVKKNEPEPREPIPTAVIVLCEPAHFGTRGLETSLAVLGWLRANNYRTQDSMTIDLSAAELKYYANTVPESDELIVVCGGTGIGPGDIVPQTLAGLCDYAVPGIGEMLRAGSLKYSLNSHLSRCGGYVYKGKLVLSIPGNPKAALEQLELMKDLLPHAVDAVKGRCKSRRGT